MFKGSFSFSSLQDPGLQLQTTNPNRLPECGGSSVLGKCIKLCRATSEKHGELGPVEEDDVGRDAVQASGGGFRFCFHSGALSDVKAARGERTALVSSVASTISASKTIANGSRL